MKHCVRVLVAAALLAASAVAQVAPAPLSVPHVACAPEHVGETVCLVDDCQGNDDRVLWATCTSTTLIDGCLYHADASGRFLIEDTTLNSSRSPLGANRIGNMVVATPDTSRTLRVRVSVTAQAMPVGFAYRVTDLKELHADGRTYRAPAYLFIALKPPRWIVTRSIAQNVSVPYRPDEYVVVPIGNDAQVQGDQFFSLYLDNDDREPYIGLTRWSELPAAKCADLWTDCERGVVRRRAVRK